MVMSFVQCLVACIAVSHFKLYTDCGWLAESHGRALPCAAEWGGLGQVLEIDVQKQRQEWHLCCFAVLWMIGSEGSSLCRHQPHVCDVHF